MELLNNVLAWICAKELRRKPWDIDCIIQSYDYQQAFHPKQRKKEFT